MTRILHWALVLATALCVAEAAHARTYYVATNGNDGNDGSLGRPFRTIARGLWAASVPGDTVMVREGTYTPSEGLWMGSPGRAGRPITLTSYPDEHVIIDGSSTPPDETLIVVGRSYITISGLELRNAKGAGISIWGPGSLIHHIEIRDNDIRDSFESAIYVANQSRTNPIRDIHVEGNRLIHNCLVNEGGHAPGWPIACGAGRGRRVSYVNNVVAQNYGEGIGFFLSDNCLARGNVVYDNFSVNLYLDNTTDTTLEGNFVYGTGDRRFDRFGLPASGVQVANEHYPESNPSARNIVRNNVISMTRSAFYYGNYQGGGGLVDTLVAHNSIYGTVTALLVIDSDSHSGSTFANNVFQQVGGNPMTWISAPTKGLDFANNLWHGGSPDNVARSPGDVYADPLYLAPGPTTALGHRLSALSPARGRAVPVSEVPDDYEGTPRDRLPDIGAFEISPNSQRKKAGRLR